MIINAGKDILKAIKTKTAGLKDKELYSTYVIIHEDDVPASLSITNE